MKFFKFFLLIERVTMAGASTHLEVYSLVKEATSGNYKIPYFGDGTAEKTYRLVRYVLTNPAAEITYFLGAVRGLSERVEVFHHAEGFQTNANLLMWNDQSNVYSAGGKTIVHSPSQEADGNVIRMRNRRNNLELELLHCTFDQKPSRIDLCFAVSP
jgi:hypothetical protein